MEPARKRQRSNRLRVSKPKQKFITAEILDEHGDQLIVSEEIWMMIMEMLKSRKDLISLMRTCHGFYRLGRDNRFWIPVYCSFAKKTIKGQPHRYIRCWAYQRKWLGKRRPNWTIINYQWLCHKCFDKKKKDDWCDTCKFL